MGQLYDFVTGDEDARVCKDIPPESCNDQPRNFFAYLVANLLSKVASTKRVSITPKLSHGRRRVPVKAVGSR